MKTCAHPRCDTTVADHELACPPHWGQLPELLRNRIWRNWRRNPGGKAHTAAVAQARAHWRNQAPEAVLRCIHCKSKAAGVDVDTGEPTCLTCLRIEVPTLGAGGGDLLECPRCRRLVVGITTVGDGPDLCCHCQERTLAA